METKDVAYTFESYAAPTIPGTPPGTVPYALHAEGARAVAADLLAQVTRLEEELRAARWDYDEAMLQYNAAQKRACDAEAALPAAVAAEREACAVLVDATISDAWTIVGEGVSEARGQRLGFLIGVLQPLAAEIRARGQG